MFDNVSIVASEFNHLPGGANILYMDGHVSFVKYPSITDYPVTRAWAMLATTNFVEADLIELSDGCPDGALFSGPSRIR